MFWSLKLKFSNSNLPHLKSPRGLYSSQPLLSSGIPGTGTTVNFHLVGADMTINEAVGCWGGRISERLFKKSWMLPWNLSGPKSINLLNEGIPDIPISLGFWTFSWASSTKSTKSASHLSQIQASQREALGWIDCGLKPMTFHRLGALTTWKELVSSSFSTTTNHQKLVTLPLFVFDDFIAVECLRTPLVQGWNLTLSPLSLENYRSPLLHFSGASTSSNLLMQFYR